MDGIRFCIVFLFIGHLWLPKVAYTLTTPTLPNNQKLPLPQRPNAFYLAEENNGNESLSNGNMENTTTFQLAPVTLEPQAPATYSAGNNANDEDAPEKLILFHCSMLCLTGISTRYLLSLRRRRKQAR